MATQRKLGIIIPLIIVGVLGLLAGLGYLGYKFYAAGKVEQEVKQAIADLEKANPGLSIKYDSMAMSVQTGRVNLNKLTVTHPEVPATLTAEVAAVRDLTAVGITRLPSSIIMNQVVIAGKDGKVTIENLEVSAAVNRLVTRQEVANDPLLLLEVVRQADIVLKNLAVAAPGVKFSLGAVSLSYGADREQKLHLTVNQLAVDHKEMGPGTQVGLDEVKFQVDLNRRLARQEVEADPTVLLAALQHFDFTVKNIVVKEKQGKFSLGGASLIWKEKERKAAFSLTGLDLNHPEAKFSLESYANHLTLDPQNVVVYSDISLKNFVLPLPAARGSDAFNFFRDLGYSSFKFNLDGKGDYDPKTLSDTSMLQLNGENMGVLSLEFKGTGYQRPPLPLKGGLLELLGFAQKWEEAITKYALSQIQLTYRDQGLVRRILEWGGRNTGKSAKAISQEIVNHINGTLLLFPLPQSLKDQVKGVNQFITNPNEIQIALIFKKPVPLKRFQNPDPDQMLNLLAQSEFKITAK